MMSEVRSIAAFGHLIGLTWLPITIAICQVPPIAKPYSEDLAWNLPLLLISPTIGIVLASLLTILGWKINRSKHSFIDRCGRGAVNVILSYCFYSILTSIILFLSLYIPSIASGLDYLMPIFALGLHPVVLVGYSIVTLLGANRAWAGKTYNYPRIIFKFVSM
jgi:uncharacterized Tic20 family protein